MLRVDGIKEFRITQPVDRKDLEQSARGTCCGHDPINITLCPILADDKLGEAQEIQCQLEDLDDDMKTDGMLTVEILLVPYQLKLRGVITPTFMNDGYGLLNRF